MVQASAPISIRACRPDEIAAVLDLWKRAEAVPSATDTVEGLNGLLATDVEALLVADIGGKIVGCLIAAWDGWRGNMYRLAVMPEYRRRGIGRALVVAGEERLRAQGARRLSALVIESHDPAMGFWEAAGYSHDKRIGRFVKTHS
jgi:ribosomal protein S18 acetylase RimI-like enzyme